MKASSNPVSGPASLAKFFAASGLVFAAALGYAGKAHSEVIWSVGVHEPGVNVRVSNAPRPVVVAQAPVVIAQQPVVVTHPVVYYPAPQRVVQQVIYAEPHHHHHPRGHAYGYWRGHERAQVYREHGRGHGHGYEREHGRY